MALQEGDSLTLHRQAVVWLSKYDSLKPRASLTRVIGPDPEEDREDMERVLYVELRAATLRELQGREELESLLGTSIQLTRLIKHCEAAIHHGPDGPEATEALNWPTPPQSKPRRKARRRAKRRTS